jgi:phosphatidylinositol-3-phosphatase
MLKYIPHIKIVFVMFAVACVLALPGANAAPAQDAEVPTPDAATHLHHIKTVFIIVMENHNWTGDGRRSIKGNPAAPYINYTLLPEASHAEDYSNPPGNHPSLPNYLWLESGTNFGIKNDNTPAHNHQGTREHLVTLLEHAGISWKSYDEDSSGKVCPLTDEGPRDANGNPLYGVRHDPFVYFDDVTGNRNAKSSYCIAHIRPFTEFEHDLASNHVARYNFITPNVCDDMHDACGGDPIAHGDAWLRRNVPHILNSTAFRSGGALFITWDEAASKNGPIPMLVLSPFAKGNHYSDHLYYTHGSMLRTVEEIFGVSPLMRDAAHERDLRYMFRVFP